ncbi:MAG TPA: tetratricopeptide repeat protein [Polyangiaceae bacterium]|nr:tetratricopeptide repeat protein [Polyangiaceae bacterium]
MKLLIVAGLCLGMICASGLGAPALANDTQLASLYRESYQLEANRDYAAALAKMREIKSKAAGSYFASLRLGWVAYLAGDYQASEVAYREAATAAPKAVEPRLGLTLPLLAARKWRELERATRDVLALDPNNAVARARLAHAQYSVGNYPDSATTYRKLIEEYPAELDHQTGLGWCLLKMGRKAEARQTFGGVLAVSPDNANAKAGMAVP